MPEPRSAGPPRCAIYAGAKITDSTYRNLTASGYEKHRRIQLVYNGSTVTAYGEIVSSDRGKGMALKFRGTAPDEAAIVKRWLFATDRPKY